LERAAWLADDTLLTVGWSMAPPADVTAQLVTADGSHTLEARWATYPRPDLDVADGAGRVTIIRLPSPLHRHQPGTLTLRSAGAKWSVAMRDLPRFTASARDVVGCGVGWLDPASRSRILAFLCESLDRGRQTNRQVAESLASLRDVLRPALPERALDHSQACATRLELVLRLDETSFYLRGWLYLATADPARLTAVSPEGLRTEILDTAYRFRRLDVDSPQDGAGKAGFIAFVRLPKPSVVNEGWLVELQSTNNAECQSPGCLVVTGRPPVVRDALLGDLDLDPDGHGQLIERHISPAIGCLQALERDSNPVSESLQLGPAVDSPDVSVIIPLFTRLDLMEQQLAQFALDPELHGVELIYVLDSPELSETLRDLARQLHQLYRLSFRVVFLTRNVGFARANNAAASLATGRLLLLLNSDVIPAGQGWIGRMQAFWDATPRIGALGVKLLYEDETLQHAGLYFERDDRTGVWGNQHYFKGLEPTFGPANVAKPVPGVTGACLMVARTVYLDHGGLRGLYLQGDYEDSDLCLRLMESGYDNWYFPDVQLYHLEGQSYGWTGRARLSRYNAWMHTHLWNDEIEAAMARFRS
jgi:GT2 family glycosyltransferase